MTCGRREKPDKKRALEVRLVREVQVLNLNLLLAACLKETTAHSFRGTCMKAIPKARGNVGRDAAEIRRMALAGAAFFLMSRWCKARVCESPLHPSAFCCNSHMVGAVGTFLV